MTIRQAQGKLGRSYLGNKRTRGMVQEVDHLLSICKTLNLTLMQKKKRKKLTKLRLVFLNEQINETLASLKKRLNKIRKESGERHYNR
jgi:N-glycosylase/DNA lyase